MKKIATMILLVVVLAAFIQPVMAEKPDRAVNDTQGNGNDKPGQNYNSSRPSISTPANQTPTFKGQPLWNNANRNDWLKRSINATVAGLNMIIRDLSIYRDRIVDSKMSADNKAIIIGQIDENLTWFEAKKVEVQGSTDVASIKSIAVESGQRWYQMKADIKKEMGMLTCDDYDTKILQASNASSIVQARIDLLKAKGNNTAQAERKLADYNEKVAKASSYIEQAREAFGNIDGPVGADAQFRNGVQLLTRADIELKLAYNDLKQIYRLIFGNRIIK